MKAAAVSLLAAWAAIAIAAPPPFANDHDNNRDHALSHPKIHHAGAGAGPCDLSSEDTGCYLIMDNSGCFLNTSDTSRVLGCADPDPAVAIDIFCRCWGCNGQELVNFMPTLNCTSKTVVPVKPMPKPMPVIPPVHNNGTNITIPNNATHPTTGPGPRPNPGKGPAASPHMPVPVLPDGY
ncbi:hypothetical protein Sste5346_007116 [Sporothrix stenoceras]|uniref:Uncharacterized protein n=1 Tax=Sporothrix stenoceras TaxID=5173 RepID=A0ABR3YX96_9PEZI